MDLYSVLRTLGSLGVVLGILAGALWAVRRFDLRLPGRVGGGSDRRLDLIERAALDARRSVALFRRDGREHLILLAPEGNVLLETGIVRDEIDLAAEARRAEERRLAAEAAEAKMAAARAELEAMRHNFAHMVETTSAKARDKVGQAVSRAGEAVTRIELDALRDGFAKVVDQSRAALNDAKSFADWIAQPGPDGEPETATVTPLKPAGRTKVADSAETPKRAAAGRRG